MFYKTHVLVRVHGKDTKILVESRTLLHVFFWTHIYMQNRFVVIICSDFRTTRKFLGRVCIGVKGSIDMYYHKHNIRTWIKRSCKVTKALIVEFVLYVSIFTNVMVMTRILFWFRPKWS